MYFVTRKQSRQVPLIAIREKYLKSMSYFVGVFNETHLTNFSSMPSRFPMGWCYRLVPYRFSKRFHGDERLLVSEHVGFDSVLWFAVSLPLS